MDENLMGLTDAIHSRIFGKKIAYKKYLKNHNRFQSADKIINRYTQEFDINIEFYKKTKGGVPSYIIALNTILMPQARSFKSMHECYSTLFHELVHSTGKKNRLNREFLFKCSCRVNHKEEIIAELGSVYLMYLCRILNEETFMDSVDYIEPHILSLSHQRTYFRQLAWAALNAAQFIMLNQKT